MEAGNGRQKHGEVSIPASTSGPSAPGAVRQSFGRLLVHLSFESQDCYSNLAGIMMTIAYEVPRRHRGTQGHARRKERSVFNFSDRQRLLSFAFLDLDSIQPVTSLTMRMSERVLSGERRCDLWNYCS